MITNFFLRAKPWQLFALLFGLPVLFQFVMMGSIFANIGNGAHPEPAFPMNFFAFFPVLMVITTGTFFGWVWAIAIGLQSRVPAHIKMKTGTFKVFFFIPLVYILVLSLGIGALMSGLPDMIEGGEEPNPGFILGSVGIIFPLHLFSMFCIFYCLYFVAKTFKTVELQRETSFSDFGGEFFLIWFYPVGIWIIQPKVNEMAGNGTGVAAFREF